MSDDLFTSQNQKPKLYIPSKTRGRTDYGLSVSRSSFNFRRQTHSEPNDMNYENYFNNNQQRFSRNDDTVLHRNARIEADLFIKSGSGINFDLYDSIPVECVGGNVPECMDNFSSIDFGEVLNLNISLCNYTKPTPIQKYAIPILLESRDMMACAQTGSGKTAAFVLPVVYKLYNEKNSGKAQKRYRGPSALIVAPTRELAQQIYVDAKRLTYRTGLKCTAIYGGCSQFRQVSSINCGCDILIATPGRLIDLLTQGIFSLEDCNTLILDEADRMLDMGFEPQIRRAIVVGNMPATGVRQTVMFSATFPPKIQQLAREFLKNEIFVTVGKIGSISENITQSIIWVPAHKKLEKLHDLVNELKDSDSDCRILVFVDRKASVDNIEASLFEAGHRVVSIHGDRVQNERDQALSIFKAKKAYILVATDVAQRGLDIPNVTHVINYSFPGDMEDYVHRIGRTGRVGNTGTAITFFDDSCSQFSSDLKKLLVDNKQVIPDFLQNIPVNYNSGPRRDSYFKNNYRNRNFKNNNSFSSFDRFSPKPSNNNSYWAD